jgi:hypothetical protein
LTGVNQFDNYSFPRRSSNYADANKEEANVTRATRRRAWTHSGAEHTGTRDVEPRRPTSPDTEAHEQCVVEEEEATLGNYLLSLKGKTTRTKGQWS